MKSKVRKIEIKLSVVKISVLGVATKQTEAMFLILLSSQIGVDQKMGFLLRIVYQKTRFLIEIYSNWWMSDA